MHVVSYLIVHRFVKERKNPGMSILSYFKLYSLPTPKETEIGDSATREANQEVKH